MVRHLGKVLLDQCFPVFLGLHGGEVTQLVCVFIPAEAALLLILKHPPVLTCGSPREAASLVSRP